MFYIRPTIYRNHYQKLKKALFFIIFRVSSNPIELLRFPFQSSSIAVEHCNNCYHWCQILQAAYRGLYLIWTQPAKQPYFSKKRYWIIISNAFYLAKNWHKTNVKLKRLYEILNGKTEQSKRDKEKLQSIVSDISHQVKSPAANLKMYMQILSRQDIDEEKRREFLELSAAQAEIGRGVV